MTKYKEQKLQKQTFEFNTKGKQENLHTEILTITSTSNPHPLQDINNQEDVMITSLVVINLRTINMEKSDLQQ